MVFDLEYNHYRREYRGCDGNPDTFYRGICGVLQAMKELVSLDWKGNSIASFVLDCRESCPQVSLTAYPHERQQRQLRTLDASDDTLVRRLQHYRLGSKKIDCDMS